MLNHSASLTIQRVFLKPCLVNWISIDIHLVYSCLHYLQVMKVGEFSGQKVQDVKKVVQKQMIDKVI